MRIHHEHDAGKSSHLLDAAEIGLQFGHFLFKEHDFLFGKQVKFAVRFHFFEFFKPFHAGTHGLEVGEATAQPTGIDIILPASFRFFLNGVLRLLLGADEKDGFARFRAFAYEFVRFFDEGRRQLQIDDVDVVSRRKDVLLHLRIPLSRLMSEMDARFQKLFHSDHCHNSFLRFTSPTRVWPHLIRNKNFVFYGHGMRTASGVNF